MNGMHITVLTTVADDSRTRLSGGLAPQRQSPLQARTIAYSVISALPLTFYRKSSLRGRPSHCAVLPLPLFLRERRAPPGTWDALKRQLRIPGRGATAWILPVPEAP